MGSYGEDFSEDGGPGVRVAQAMLGGASTFAMLRMADLPGWSFALSGGRIAFVSGSLASWLGYESTATLIGAPGAALLAAPHRGRARGRALLGLLRRGGAPVHVEMAEVEITLEGQPSVLFWAPGQGAELQEKPRRAGPMTSIAASLAHELNNPLTYLNLNLDFIERELKKLDAVPTETEHLSSVARASEALRVVREGAERLSSIVRDLRAFSRAGEGPRPVDLRRLLELALALTRNTLRHRVHLQLELQDVGDVHAGEAELGQSLVALLLLLTHAIEDGAASGHQLEIRLEQPGDQVELSFLVRGPKARLFPESDPEFLSLQARVAALGGELSQASPRVLLRLPLSHEERPARPVTSIPPPSSQGGVRPRVLLVEEEPAIADALRVLLQEEAEIEHVSSGRVAIDTVLRDQSYRLILCDLTMPDIGGIDVHEAIRRARPGVERRIVFLTGGPFSQRTREFLRSTPNRILDKPIDPALLLSLLRSLR
ncbi:MAG: response regulator [Polyangiaceae bacterium]|nr:response regulator [Polyangiaceae bacterium]